MVKFVPFKDIDYKLISEKIKNTKFVKSGRKKPNYLDISVSFDTETTSTYVHKQKFAFMYIWQFGIDGYYFYGRTWKQFLNVCAKLQKIGKLDKEHRIIIYVHNFAYEFQFLRKYFNWLSVFATDNRYPVKALTDYGIEFRDSLILSGYKLETLAKNLTSHKIPKLVGDLDYRKIRTKDTIMTAKELGYCLNDVRVLVAYIDEQRAMYGNISKIPLTNTGRVRREVKSKCFDLEHTYGHKHTWKYYKYHQLIKKLTLTPNEYLELKQAFAGGFTHANPNHVGKVMKNVASIDFTSSYPTVMVSEQYPMSKGYPQKFTSWARFNEINEKALQIFQVDFIDLEPKVLFDNYLSESKCFNFDKDDIVVNNGRVFSAHKISTVTTSVDWFIIKQVYKWKKATISRQIAYYKGYLPKPIIESVYEFYRAKTKLKGIPSKKPEYLHGKMLLNSCYGMSVTDLVHDELIYDDKDEQWKKEPADLDKQIDKYNTNYERFLFYPWGVFVTAYARANLWSGLLSIQNDYLYSDTDSIKFINYKKHLPYVKAYNKRVQAKIIKVLKMYKLPLNWYKPKTVKGIEKPLGVWDVETGVDGSNLYKRFKTLGAKKYCYDDNTGFHITIAGLNKSTGAKYLLKLANGKIKDTYKYFTNNLKVPCKYSGRLTHTYIDGGQQAIIKDFQGHVTKVTAMSAVHLEPATFTMNISDTYLYFLSLNLQGEYLETLNPIAKGV